MKEKLIFCEYCRDDVPYRVEEVSKQSKLKGKLYDYDGKVAVCSECNEEVYLAEVNDYNLESLYREYRKQNGIVALENIREIIEKYSIGKRPLSKLLGWGEQTFSRYFDGDMPTQQYSEILKNVYDNPEYYLDILENNKSNITKTAYEKSKLAAEKHMNTTEVTENKLELTAEYIILKCRDITPLALQKLLYYVQGFYFAFNRKFIFTQNCEAWIHGPVYRQIYNQYKDYRYEAINLGEIEKEFDFTASEKIIIENVINHLSCYSGKVLEEFTHAEIPWLVTRGELKEDENSNRDIQKSLIGEYFEQVKEKNDMVNATDIKIYSKKMFKQLTA